MSYTIMALLSLLIGVGCSGSGSNRYPDADQDRQIDADETADADRAVDAETPLPDGTPPSCSELGDDFELTPEPVIALEVAAAADGQGYAIATLEGNSHSQDLVITRFDATLTPIDERLIVAEGLLYAEELSLSLGQNGATISWLEPPDPDSCDGESTCLRDLRAILVPRDSGVPTASVRLTNDMDIERRAAHVVLDDQTLLITLGSPGTTLQLVAVRIDSDGNRLGTEQILVPDASLRGAPPAAVLAGERLVVVAEAAPGGLIGATFTADEGELLTGPTRIIDDASASAPALATLDNRIGLTYIDSSPTPPGNRLNLAEMNDELQLSHEPTVLLDEDLWPRYPALVGLAPGWVVTWHDGRHDSAPDCVNSGFCREDVFVLPASLAGADSEPLRVSVDPNDCRSPRIAANDGRLLLAWLTYREARRTSFARSLTCD